MAMNGYKYERYCARYLKKQGFRRVTVTRKSCDQGIDLIAHKKFKKYGFQCKYYASSVGNKAVQEAFSGAAFYGCNYVVVITNSTFTPAAKELAEKTDVLLWDGVKPTVFNRLRLFFSRFIWKVILLLGLLTAAVITVTEKKFDGSVKLAYESFISFTELERFPFFATLEEKIPDYLFFLIVLTSCAIIVLLFLLALVRRREMKKAEQRKTEEPPVPPAAILAVIAAENAGNEPAAEAYAPEQGSPADDKDYCSTN